MRARKNWRKAFNIIKYKATRKNLLGVKVQFGNDDSSEIETDSDIVDSEEEDAVHAMKTEIKPMNQLGFRKIGTISNK